MFDSARLAAAMEEALYDVACQPDVLLTHTLLGVLREELAKRGHRGDVEITDVNRLSWEGYGDQYGLQIAVDGIYLRLPITVERHDVAAVAALRGVAA